VKGGASPEIAIGHEIPTFVREATFHHWNRYAAVNDEFYDIHMDDEAGRAAGYTSAIGMGNLQWAYMHNVVRGWVGEHGRLLTMTCQFRGPSLRNSIVRARGIVRGSRTEGDHQEVELEVWTENGTGERMAVGSATVLITLAGGGQ